MAAFERATVGLFLWWSASAALGNDAFDQVLASPLAVAEAAERIEQGVRTRGLRIVQRTDHTAQARRAGYRLRPTQSLMIDVQPGARPVRLVIWQAANGATMVSVDGESLRDAGPDAAVLPDLVGACLAVRREGSEPIA